MFNVLNIFNSLLSDNRIILCNKCYIPKSIFVGSLFDKFLAFIHLDLVCDESDIHFLLVNTTLQIWNSKHISRYIKMFDCYRCKETKIVWWIWQRTSLHRFVLQRPYIICFTLVLQCNFCTNHHECVFTIKNST